MPESPLIWTILDELAALPEPERRRILRLEAGFNFSNEADMMGQRLRLDLALTELTKLEIGYQLGVLTEADSPVPRVGELCILFLGSEAILRYADAYLYFGVRFLAGRVAPLDWMTEDRSGKLPFSRTTNVRPFALLTPPLLSADAARSSEFERFFGIVESSETTESLKFLDCFTKGSQDAEVSARFHDYRDFELWLQGLRPDADPFLTHLFEMRVRGLTEWATGRADFYSGGLRLERPLGGWIVTDPAAARYGLNDLYWIASLLRADVSATGAVTYSRSSWLHLLRVQAAFLGQTDRQEQLRRAEEILRSVFGFVCDLIQNAAELTADLERRAFEPSLFTTAKSGAVKWRQTFDDELEEITRQRDLRRFDPSPSPSPTISTKPNDGWSNRIKTGRRPYNLVGLAFSGGGIRSATFNLGVLQALRDLDVLRYVDYLSTVSGGGFIGGWLAANVSRTTHWLGKLTSWEESIAYLREYSNYLAPRSGLFSPDTWTMWGIWARNAFLIQLTALAWLIVLLLLVFLGQHAFFEGGQSPAWFHGVPRSRLLTAAMMVPVGLSLLWNLIQTRRSSTKWAFSTAQVQLLAVVPSCIASFLVAALLWGDATSRSDRASDFAGLQTYSSLLANAVYPWKELLIFMCGWFTVIAVITLRRRVWQAPFISVVCTAALYLQLCGVMRLFQIWSADAARSNWYAFVSAPALVLFANTLSVVLFIGFCGRDSEDSLREWWTRFGSWLAFYSAAYLAVTAAAVFGPLGVFWLVNSHPHWSIRWGALATWVGTIIAGLLAGNSTKTNGSQIRSKWLEFVAKAGGLLFIVTAVLVAATLLHLVMVQLQDSHVADYWRNLSAMSFSSQVIAFLITVILGLAFSWFFEINIFGLNQFYRNRLVRCYLGASRWAPGVRHPQPFTDFDASDDLSLSELRGDYRGPFPIINCALNLAGGSDLSLHTRQSASFMLTPLRCGAHRDKMGYAPTSDFAGGVKLGQAIAISGAAASPNMGYNTSPLVAFLLTLFNVRLGWWFANPGQPAWTKSGLGSSLYYLIKELTGSADEENRFVNVSDGGHFENLGVYELVRRRCKVIIASDAECDEFLTFGSLGNLVRICETDFGAKIDIDLTSIQQQKEGVSMAHCSIGRISYKNGSFGFLIYLKASIIGKEGVGIAQYRSVHPTFPHESTANQFFSEDQFESYRTLGQHVVKHSFRAMQTGDHPVTLAEILADVLAPTKAASESFLRHTKTLDAIWDRFRTSRGLDNLLQELMPTPSPAVSAPLTNEEICAGLELIQLMEDVFLDLRLDDFWDNPDNRGWAMLFMRWARSPRFREIWKQSRRMFGIRFEYFCDSRLGLPRDEPIARV